MELDELNELEVLEQGLTGWDRHKACKTPKAPFDRGRIGASGMFPLPKLYGDELFDDHE